MQDRAIQSRTQLRLNAELEEQRQKLRDFQLQKEGARTDLSAYYDQNSLTSGSQKDCLIRKCRCKHVRTIRQSSETYISIGRFAGLFDDICV